MTAALTGITIFSHYVLPLLFIAWVAFSRAKSRIYWLGVVGLTFGYLFMMYFAGAGWHWIGFYWNYLFVVLFAAAAAWFHARNQVLPWKPANSWDARAGVLTVWLVALYFSSSIPTLLGAGSFEEESVEFGWPLKGGTFYVVHGGSAVAVNHHYEVSAQKYALDVSKLNGLGVRASGLWPSDLDRYAIYESPVLAPCSGEVLALRDGLKDLTPPDMDGGDAAGNYIALYCNDSTVLMGHLREGSIGPKEGDLVSVGQAIALVGNSGNTSEPHLHIHAVKGRQTDHKVRVWTGEGVPMVFNKRFLTRGDTVSM